MIAVTRQVSGMKIGYVVQCAECLQNWIKKLEKSSIGMTKVLNQQSIEGYS